MANVMRWRYGETNPVMAPVLSDTVIEIGDLVILDSGTVKPATAISYSSTLQATQELFHDKFLGVAMQASAAGETSDVRVATSGVFEFPQASASITLGSRMGIDDNGDGDALTPQQIIMTTAPETSIGRCAKATTSSTTILVTIKSTIMDDGPQASA